MYKLLIGGKVLNYNMRKEIYILKYNKNISIRSIAKKLKISKTTVLSHLREIEKGLEEIKSISDPIIRDQKKIELFTPKKVTRNKKPRVFTQQHIEYIKQIIEENKVKIKTNKHKYIMKGQDIFEVLEESYNYQGSVRAVRYQIKKIVKNKKEVFCKIHKLAGDKAEFDWGSLEICINDKVQNFKLAVFTLPYSNYRFAYIYHNERMGAFTDSHVRFFNKIQGVTQKVVYDNMKVVVAKFTAKGKDNIPTKTLEDMSKHYDYEFVLCNEYSPNEKGNVETSYFRI